MRNWQPTSPMEATTGKFDVNQWDDFISNRLSEDTENLYEESSRWIDRHLLMRVLRHTKGNQLHAARILGISRATLRSKVRRVGIRVDEINW
jgi:DNA-binding protein Fis